MAAIYNMIFMSHIVAYISLYVSIVTSNILHSLLRSHLASPAGMPSGLGTPGFGAITGTAVVRSGPGREGQGDAAGASGSGGPPPEAKPKKSAKTKTPAQLAESKARECNSKVADVRTLLGKLELADSMWPSSNSNTFGNNSREFQIKYRPTNFEWFSKKYSQLLLLPLVIILFILF